MKKFQHIHIMILAVFVIGLLVSAIFAINSLKEMSKLQGENTNFISSFPVIQQMPTPYGVADSQKVLDLFNKNDKKPTFDVTNRTGEIVITTNSIENEADVRGALMVLLALDRNLKLSSFCGKSNNSCNGSAFEIILKGEKVNASVKTSQPIIPTPVH